MGYDTRWHADAWDDLRSPATGINPPGAASDPTFNITECALEFSGSSDNIVAMIHQAPHGWKQGSPWRPHLHVYARVDPVTPKTVNWKLEYKVYDRGDVVPAVWQELTAVQTLTSSDYNTSQIISFGEIDMSSITGLAGMVKYKLTRVVSGQTYNSPVFLDEFDTHIIFDSSGSIEYNEK